MTSDTRVTMHKGAAALVAIALLTVGGGATYVLMRNDGRTGGQVADMPSPAGAASRCPCTSGPVRRNFPARSGDAH